MKKIKEFLESHPLISYNSIGVVLGLRDGQLRADRDIPKKYLVEVEKILMGYGYLPDLDSVNEMVTMPEKKFLTDHGTLIDEAGNEEMYVEPNLTHKTHVSRNGSLGVVEGTIFKRSVFDDGDYYVEKL